MKKQWISLVTGIAIGGLVFGSVGASFASSATKAINATYKNIKLVVDGATVVPKDPNGNAVEPFIYNGTTYLPIRAVGQVFNKEVSWDGATNTVFIGAKPAKVAKEVFLFDKPYTSCSDPSGFKNFEEKGKNYVGFENGSGQGIGGATVLDDKRSKGTSEVIYPLNGNAMKVEGTLIAPDEDSAEYSIAFYDENNKKLYGSSKIRKNMTPIDFSADTDGVLSLKIAITLENNIGWTSGDSYSARQYIQNLRIMTTEY